MILHILLKTTLLLLFVTSLQAQISAFKLHLDVKWRSFPAWVFGNKQQQQQQQQKQKQKFFFLNVKIGGADYTALRPYRRQIR